VEPEIRASLLKLYLARLDVRGKEEAAAARAALGADAVRRIERTRGNEWLPMAWEVSMLRAVHGMRGDEGVRELGRELGRAAIEDALLGPLVKAMLGMLGRRPDVLLQLSLAGWGTATRNAGRGSIIERTDGLARLAIDALPAALRERALLLRICGSVEALLEMGGVAARAEPGGEDRDRLYLAVSWGAGRSRSR